MRFQLPAGRYCIGDPLFFLLPDVLNYCFNNIINPGFYYYEKYPFLIDCTGFDEGSFIDADNTEYIIYNGLLGIMPCEICRSEENIIGGMGRYITYPLPFTIDTDGDGYFELNCCQFRLLLDTSMDDDDDSLT